MPTVPSQKKLLDLGWISSLLVLFLSALLFSCSEESKDLQNQCIGCHQIKPDANHLLGCTSCHLGDGQTSTMDKAHLGLIKNPASLENMEARCGKCHQKQLDGIGESSHFTLAKSTNLFRRSFGAKTLLNSYLETPEAREPATPLELADDLLRRRCFRCHLGSKGDDYPATHRGLGCAACHLAHGEDGGSSHQFTAPADANCLSCHYGNYVGFDYYGRFEHDLNHEYRTPYPISGFKERPFGVEYHQLAPDIHQEAGLWCIDCHGAAQLMYGSGLKEGKLSCISCHIKKRLLAEIPAEKILKKQEGLFLRGAGGGLHPLVFLTHPAHFTRGPQVACQSCHAQWSYNDRGKHYLRSDTDNIDLFEALAVQGSSEVESLVINNNDFDKEELPLIMTDKISGEQKAGVWYKGFTERRWQDLALGRDKQGLITPVRPVLDYYLSWIDEDETVRFDSVPATPIDGIMAPYTPHTTGPAGLFYQERLEAFLKKEAGSGGPSAP